MNSVLFTASDGFTHGEYHFQRKGDAQIVPEHIAESLQAAGLGTIKPKPRMMNKMLPDSTVGNVGGPGASSASSQVAPPSTSTTLNQSGSGKTLTLRNTK
jgi:hypothetical protein